MRMVWLALICAGLISVAHAHDPGLSSATVTLQPERMQAEIILSKVDAAILLTSLTSTDETLNPNQLAAGLEKFAADSLELELDGQIVPAKSVHGSADESGNILFSLGYDRGPAGKILVRSKWISQLPPGHREFLSIQKSNGQLLLGRLLSASSESASCDLGGNANLGDPARKNAFTNFLAMGVMHIWTGYDHLLFLFGLLAVTRQVKTVLKIVTCFTVAHSLTLAIASLNILTIPSRIVEPMIAASIVFVGVENFLRNGEPKGRWLLTFGFGLIHGFGFASALREVGVGEHGGGVVLPLVSFNLGVELGQIAIAAVALPIIWKLRDQPGLVRRWIPVTSSVVGVLGTYWFIQRI